MRNYFIALCILLFAGCTKADVESVSQQKINSQKFHAEFAEEDTRTFVDEKVRLLWTEGDLLTIFTSTLNRKYQFDGETGDNSGTFSEIATSQFGTGNSISANYAVYPYFSSNKISNDEVITLSLPATQQYAEGSFGQDANTMVAVTSGPNDYFLPFKNVGGFLRLRLYGDGVTVRSIELKGNNSEKIAGKATVTSKYGQNPELEMSASATESITLDCGDGVALSATATEAKDFWIVVPPTTFTKGFTITITDTAGATMEKSTTKSYVVERNVLKSMTAFEVKTNIEDVLAIEREALITFYKATGGDNWTNNTNWCSDKPVGEWYGIQTNDEGLVATIELPDNNLCGIISKNILPNLRYLGSLWCMNNNLQKMEIDNSPSLVTITCYNNPLNDIIVNNLPKLRSLNCSDCLLETLDLSTCKELEGLYCANNNLTSLDIGKNAKLTQLDCSNNPIITLDFSNNPLIETLWANTCQLKELNVSNLVKLQVLLCSENELGNININNNVELKTLWCSSNNLSMLDVTNNPKLCSLICGNTLDLTNGSVLEGNNHISEIDVSNNPELEALFISGNKLTLLDVTHNTKLRQLELHSNNVNHLDLSKNIALEELYYAFNGAIELDISNNTLLKHLECSRNNIIELDLSKNTNLEGLYCSYNDLKEIDISYSPNISILSCSENHNLTKIYVNSTQKFEYWKDDTAEFVYKDGGTPDTPSYYESSDYSQDGVVTTLQSASQGAGINIVLMGDGYSDRLIADGTYDKVMNTAMEKFFEVEPYKSFREYFNIYSVKAVSTNEVFTNGSSTAFAGYFGAETHVGGNDARVFSYAQKAIGEERMDDALIVVMMNSDTYAGTCYMYPVENGNWGRGVSVSYFPVGADDTALAQVLHHEAGGHGFSKLGDEYEPMFAETITEEAIASAQALAIYGWHKNIDFTSDPATVKWSHFLTDDRYANEGLGVYEGAFVYTTGVYRPSWNSIMRNNTGGFNAPSREAIYYRIHKLAYGADWEYDYEEFVEWDAKNRTTTRGIPYRLDIPEDFQPTHPPVIVKSSWRNAKNNAQKKVVTNNGGNTRSNLRKLTDSKAQITSGHMTTNTVIESPYITTRTITLDTSGKITTTIE